ncbi:GNAT family N-acetyltransferase [Vibrio sp. SCSIO 43136]|uniref:GNAT family N-acetyltransferase n=1 Tax=Vibrio sp. SCSIO 43136 TaxID=2819101 RepID=UPI002074FA59|nr:GNAT family N-acetyltransferase [Vibrio sp. SCSIO 43136]USD67931.1 N-acetyltransferase [Vibrio sp. SCSIO 43136]
MQIIHDSNSQEFRIELAPQAWARLTYRWDNNIMVVDHSSVPLSLRGQGKGGVMMEAFLPEVEKLGVKIIAECSYVQHYLKKHPQWHHLVA